MIPENEVDHHHHHLSLDTDSYNVHLYRHSLIIITGVTWCQLTNCHTIYGAHECPADFYFKYLAVDDTALIYVEYLAVLVVWPYAYSTSPAITYSTHTEVGCITDIQYSHSPCLKPPIVSFTNKPPFSWLGSINSAAIDTGNNVGISSLLSNGYCYYCHVGNRYLDTAWHQTRMRTSQYPSSQLTAIYRLVFATKVLF